MSVKEKHNATAGKVPAIMVKAPTIMEPSGDVPGSITIEDGDGMDMNRPNSAQKYGAPVSSLVKRARGGK